ncbi:MAG: hypothetical protein AAGF71_10355 [Pseudomonadota bacterium]
MTMWERLSRWKTTLAAITATVAAIGASVTWISNSVVQPVRVALANTEMIPEIRTELALIRLQQPPPKVAEYDLLGSRVIEPCFVGRVCAVQFDLRRTPWGMTCGDVTRLQSYLTVEGSPPLVLPEPTAQAVRVGPDYQRIIHRFEIPSYVLSAPAWFHVKVTYAGCRGFAEPVEELTPFLAFHIQESSG